MPKEKKLLFKIANFGFLISWVYPRMINPIHNHYRDFLYYKRFNQVKKQLAWLTEVRLYWAKGNEKSFALNSAKKILQIAKHWQLYQTNRGYAMKIFHPDQRRLLSLGLIDTNFKNADYHLFESDNFDQGYPRPDQRDIWFLGRLIQPFITALLINILAQHGGCLVHGVGIKLEKKGFAFLGKSGSGKTTLAKLLGKDKAITVLSDESLIISKNNGKFYLHGTPWPGGGMIANADSVALEKIFFIRHGRDNFIKPLDLKEGFQQLLPLTVLCAWDKSLLNLITTFLKDLSCQNEFFNLEFVNDKRIVYFLKNNLI
jgi:hypothetical protein